MRTIVYVDGFNLYYAVRKTHCKWLNPLSLARQVVPHAVIAKLRYFTARVSGAFDADAPRKQQIYLNAISTVPEIDFHFGSFLAKAQWRPVLMLPLAHRNTLDAMGAIQMLAPGPVSVDACGHLPGSRAERFIAGNYGGGTLSRPQAPTSDAMKSLVFSMEEKGSDVNLAVHLLNDGWAGRFDAAIVISNDTDLVEPIRIVTTELRLPVYVLTPPGHRNTASPLAAVASHVRHIRANHLQAALFPAQLRSRDGTVIQKPANW